MLTPFAFPFGWLGSGVPPIFDLDPEGRRPIGVAQPPGQGGINYPLSYPSDDITYLLADAYLNYKDDNELLQPPFHIKWLYGFGNAPPVGSPPTPNFTHEIEIIDDNGVTVFNSLDAGTTFTSEAWMDRLRVLTWTQADQYQHLTVVYHTHWSPNDAAKLYAIYFEPSAAMLHARVIHRDPPKVTSVRVGLTTYTGDIQWKNGFNTTFENSETVATGGQRHSTELILNASPGLGAGTFGPPCDPETDIIRRINGVSPADRGQFYLDTGGCYRFEQPIQAELAPTPEREVQIRKHSLQLSNDCGPCCDCDDFIAVWEAIRKLRNQYADLIARAQATRDLYHNNRQRFLDQQECRENDKLRLILQPSCPATLGVAAGYCNNSPDCISGLVLHISFQYSDTQGCTDFDGASTLTATTTAPFQTIVCDSTFRGGFVDPARRKKRKLVRNEYYNLGGTWPHYWVHFPLVDPGAMAYVTFQLQFDEPTTGQTVEGIVDAFEIGSQAPVSGGSPVPGYVLGSGCSGACESLHLVDCPVKETSQLIPDCCEESVSIA